MLSGTVQECSATTVATGTRPNPISAPRAARRLAPSTDTTISFVPEDSSGDPADEEISVPAGDLAEGTGVLVVKRGPDAGARFVLTGEVTRVGRHPDSEIFLDDVTVSRRHAEFRREGAHYVVTDVGSLNGTYVNRERIETATLKGGDEVQIGKFKLVFLSTSAG